MIPEKQLNELAKALEASVEFADMKKWQKEVEKTVQNNQFAEAFGQNNPFINSNMTLREISRCINQLMFDGQSFANNLAVQNYLAATSRYQKMFTECIRELNLKIDEALKRR